MFSCNAYITSYLAENENRETDYKTRKGSDQ